MVKSVVLSVLAGFALALLSVRVQRAGPEQVVFSNLCGPAMDQLCYKPVLNGGFPLPFLYDRAGVSREDQLAFVEDRFRPLPFLADLVMYGGLVFVVGRLLRRRHAAAGASLILFALLGGCNREERRLAAAERVWREHGIERYSFEHKFSCFCMTLRTNTWWEVTVDSGRVVSQRILDTLPPAAKLGPDDMKLEESLTIDSLFARAKESLAGDAEKFEIRYDSVYQYPSEISVDWSTQMADEEWSSSVRRFTVLRRRPRG
jgi:hypothetical protein